MFKNIFPNFVYNVFMFYFDSPMIQNISYTKKTSLKKWREVLR